MTNKTRKFRLLIAIVMALMSLPHPMGFSATYLFTVDSSTSSISLAGNAEVVLFGNFPFGTQASGSLTTNYSGSILVDLDDFDNPSTIAFVDADIVAAVNGQWQPNDSGTGMTPVGDGNYGISTAFGAGKIRGLKFRVTSSAPATITGGQFPSSTQQWKHTAGFFDIYSPALGDGNSQPHTSIAGDTEVNIAGNASISVVDNTCTISLPVNVTIGWGIPGTPTVFGDFIYTGTITASFTIATPQVVGSYVYHAGWTGGGSNIDIGKALHKEGAAPTQLTYQNLINSSHGINGIGFEVQDFVDAAGLDGGDFDFEVSSNGTSWSTIAAGTIAVTSGTPDLVTVEWPNGTIVNRWLRITVKATAKTGLSAPEVYYIGHLLGETGPTAATYSVSFADIADIRAVVGASVGPDSNVDIDKSGSVSFADISAMRSNVGEQLPNITVP